MEGLQDLSGEGSLIKSSIVSFPLKKRGIGRCFWIKQCHFPNPISVHITINDSIQTRSGAFCGMIHICPEESTRNKENRMMGEIIKTMAEGRGDEIWEVRRLGKRVKVEDFRGEL